MEEKAPTSMVGLGRVRNAQRNKKKGKKPHAAPFGSKTS